MAVALVRIDRTRQAVARARAAGHVPRPMPAQASPIAAERAYATRLRSLADRAITSAYAPLLRELPGLVDRARSERGDAADWRIDGTNSGRSASAAIKVAAASVRSELGSKAVRAAANDAAVDASAHVKAQLGKQVREVLGIDLAADSKAKARTAAFVHENVKLITGIGPTLAADIERIILSGLTAGQLHETLALAIKSRMQVAINRAELIAVDQLGKIVGQINAARQQDLGVTHFYWRSAEDERVRGNPDGLYPKAVPSHYDRNGKRYAYSDPPKGKKGERELPGTPIRCFPGATRAASVAAVSKLYRRWHRGESAVIETDQGRRLESTPNHPVLTNRGWIAAHLVEVGDYMVEASAESLDALVEDGQNADATIAELFYALAPLGVAEDVTVLGGGFHGDVSVDQDVSVVDIDRGLYLEGDPEFSQTFANDLLALADDSATSFGPLALCFDRSSAAARRIVRRGCKLAALLGAGAPHSLQHRRAAIAWLDAKANELGADGGAADVEALRELLNRLPGQVHGADLVTRVVARMVRRAIDASACDHAATAEELAQVVGVDAKIPGSLGNRLGGQKLCRVVKKIVGVYEGHVYNLETSSGWYVAQNLVVHNCRCYPDPDLSTVLGEGAAAPAPRDPAAPDAPNRAPTVEEQEAEADRLRREVEAMLAGQVPVAAPAPAPGPAPRLPRPPRAVVALGKIKNVRPSSATGHAQVPREREGEALRSGVVVALATNADQGITESYRATIEHNGERMRAIVKPESGSAAARDESGFHPDLVVREVAASGVAGLLGVADLVPTTVEVRSPVLGRSSAQAFVEGGIDTSSVTEKQGARIDEDAAVRMRVFDFVVGNTDRHGGNVMWTDDGVTVRPALIDNGFTLPTVVDINIGQPFVRGKNLDALPLTSGARAAIAAMDPAAVAASLAADGLELPAIQGTLYRIAMLKANPSILDVTPDDEGNLSGRRNEAARNPTAQLSREQQADMEQLAHRAFREAARARSSR